MKTDSASAAAPGFSGDRIEPAVELATQRPARLSRLRVPRRTHDRAGAAGARRAIRGDGFDPGLAERMDGRAAGVRRARGVTIITNMGAANPRRGRARRRGTSRRGSASAVSRSRPSRATTCSMLVMAGDFAIAETGEPVATLGNGSSRPTPTSARSPSSRRSRAGADVVITGRAADPSLFVAPLAHAFGWALDDWPQLGRGTLVGHLLECAGQVTGGYFADPGYKDVEDLSRLGFPIAEVRRGRTGRDHEGRRIGRARHAGDVQGTAAVRDPRSSRVRHAGCGRGLQPRARHRDRATIAWRSTARAAGRRPDR